MNESDDSTMSQHPMNATSPDGVDCDEAVHALYHYLDGELTDERRAVISLHLDQCAPCGSAAHFESELRRLVADQCTDRVPQSLIERVAAAINEEERHGN